MDDFEIDNKINATSSKINIKSKEKKADDDDFLKGNCDFSSSEDYSASENVKEIKVNDYDNETYLDGKVRRENVIKEIKSLERKISLIKSELRQLIGKNDYEQIMSYYKRAIFSEDNKNYDDNYQKIENFTMEKYDRNTKEKFDNLYLLLVSKDTQMNIKQNELKSIVI